MKKNIIEERENKRIEETLKHINNDIAYKYLIKMGEANELS